MTIYFDLFTAETMVAYDDGTTGLLRDFTRQRRLQLGLKVATLERRAGISHPMYRYFETGEAKTRRALPAILEELGLELRLVLVEPNSTEGGDHE